MADIVLKSIDSVEDWVEKHDYKGYEPFDGLTSYLYKFTFGSRLLRQILQQSIRRFPLNIRPILGVKPLDSTKGRGYMAWGYIKRFEATNKNKFKEKAFSCLDWLDRNKSPFYAQHSWGNHFDYSSRGGNIWKNISTVVWTGLIGQVFLEAYRIWGEKRHLEVIASVRDWIMALPREETDHGLCLSYIMEKQSSIHNSNMIGAAFLAGASKLINDSNALSVAQKAMEYSCSCQLDTGAWYYGEATKYHWVDVFHTGYNLDSLKRYIDYSNDFSFNSNLEKGFIFFKKNFFKSTGQVKYYDITAEPIDIQCFSQAIDTLVLFSKKDPECLSIANKAAIWTINNFQDKKGFFYFRIYPLGIKNKAPMIHWGQATMHKALSNLMLGLGSQEPKQNGIFN